MTEKLTHEDKAIEVAGQIVKLMKPLDYETKDSIFGFVSSLFGLGANLQKPHSVGSSRPRAVVGNILRDAGFSDRKDISPKQFMLEKDPQTDIGRVTCLAFYLTHYRDTPYFKILDIRKLNIEAAGKRISNAAYAVNNTAKRGFFVDSPKKGHRQLSAIGEQYVQAMPDSKAMMIVIEKNKRQISRKKRKKLTRT